MAEATIKYFRALAILSRRLAGGSGALELVSGPAECGKTTFALKEVAKVQAKGGVAAYIDMDHAFDAAYAESLGVDIPELVVSQPDSGDEAISICLELVDSGLVDLTILESVANLASSTDLRRLDAAAACAGVRCIFTVRERRKTGVVFGDPKPAPGVKSFPGPKRVISLCAKGRVSASNP